jgi:LysM repeat protein
MEILRRYAPQNDMLLQISIGPGDHRVQKGGWENPMRHTIISLSLILMVAVTACNNAEEPPQAGTPAAVKATAAATAAPAVSIPTAAPTEVEPSPTVTPTHPPASPTPVPTPTPLVHVVEPFDTLLGIAIDYGTTVEELVAANGIAEDDFLQLGQALIIPTGPGIEATAGLTQTTVTDSSALETHDSPTAVDASAGSTGTVAVIPGSADHTLAAAPANDPNDASAPSSAAASAPAVPAPAPTASGPPPPTISHADNINPLSGLPVDDPAKLRRRPLLVRIGNDVGARQSQVGLNSAEVVYEEITEWWVTRFTAIYLADSPNTLSPVRSARLINVQLVPQYQGALAHSGGSDPVRWEISQAPIANLDEFYNALPYFYRPNEGWQTRLAIDGQAARDYMAARGLDAPVGQQGFLFEDTLGEGEPGENIYIPYPRATSFTEWHYDAAAGKYLRWINGSALVDAAGGQVAASNVIIYFAEHQPTDIVEDANGATSIRIIVNGKGPAWFFRDGKLNKGFWETDGSRTPYFAFEDGRPYSLKPGHSWIEVVPTYFTIGLNSPDEASSSP